MIIYPLNVPSFELHNTLMEDPLYLTTFHPAVYALLLVFVIALVSISFNLMAQTIGLLADNKKSFYISLILITFIIPYVLYFGIGANILPFSSYTPLIILNEGAFSLSILWLMGYWLSVIVINLIIIYAIYKVK